jgi:Acetyltransferase (GNAT) domain
MPNRSLVQLFKAAGTRSVKTRSGLVKVTSRVADEDQDVWIQSLEPYAVDHRYYELISDTLSDQFDHRFLVLQDEDQRTRAVQPIFVIAQDLLTGLPLALRNLAEKVRTRFPFFLKLRMLMVGNSAGEADLAVDSSTREVDWTCQILREALPELSRNLGAALIVFKDFPSSYRQKMHQLTESGWVRVPSMPATSLTLDFATFDEYLTRYLSHSMRKNLRRKFRKAETLKLTFEMVTDVSPVVIDLLPLYAAVFERSKLHFEKLNVEYLSELGRRMPDRARFFLWRQGDRIVAFASCLVHNGILKDNYIGLDYSLALDYHLYFLTWRDTIRWAIENGCHTYHSAPLNYDPKRHFRMKLDPLDLYVRAGRGWMNPLVSRLLPLLEPTRYDRAIHQFPNKQELY